jgi:hypothetical protein
MIVSLKRFRYDKGITEIEGEGYHGNKNRFVESLGGK